MATNFALKNGQQVWFETVSGEVLSADAKTNAQVTQDDPSFYIAGRDLNEVHWLPGQVRTVNTMHSEARLRTVDGKEVHQKLGSMQLPMRPGHRISVLWGATAGVATGPYFAAMNHTTGQVVCELRGKQIGNWKLDIGRGKLFRSLALWTGIAIGGFAAAPFWSDNTYHSWINFPLSQLKGYATELLIFLGSGLVGGAVVGWILEQFLHPYLLNSNAEDLVTEIENLAVKHLKEQS